MLNHLTKAKGGQDRANDRAQEARDRAGPPAGRGNQGQGSQGQGSQGQGSQGQVSQGQGSQGQNEANAGEDQTVVTGATVQLDGSDSSDPEDNSLIYSWTLAAPDGSTATLSDTSIVNSTFVADVDGEYLATLVVNDGATDSDPDSVEITAAAV